MSPVYREHVVITSYSLLSAGSPGLGGVGRGSCFSVTIGNCFSFPEMICVNLVDTMKFKDLSRKIRCQPTFCCCSVAKSSLTLCDPMECNMPDFSQFSSVQLSCSVVSNSL